MPDRAFDAHKRSCFALVVITLLYHALHSMWYGGTVFGTLPVLDGAEILQLARDIHAGTLPAEPFYRAPLYAALLSPLAGPDASDAFLLTIARWINTGFHVTSVLLLYAISNRIWKHREASFVIALVYALYPVALHFAGDPFDISMAITLLLAGLLFAVANTQSRSNTTNVCAGMCWALGAITRPHLLVIVLAWPLWQLLTEKEHRARGVLAALLGPCVVLGGMGIANLHVSGHFQVMPLQGAFDLYAANRPGAHGKYMMQTREFKDADHRVNPTRLEAETLYREATHNSGPIAFREVNAYWRGQAIKGMLMHPMRTAQHMLRKTYYLANRFEQYNNKTYALHKERSPWLRFNMLGWPLVLGLGIGGFVASDRRKEVRLLALLTCVYALGVVLFYVSARFRLPLVPLLALLMGGWLQNDRKRFTFALPATVLVMLISFSTWGDVADKRTYAEDYILMSRGALRMGMDQQAEEYARAALDYQPTRMAAHKLVVLSRYNLMLARLPDRPPTEQLEEELSRCIMLKAYDPSMAFSAGIYHWMLGEQENATKTWRSLVTADSPYLESALAALLVTGQASLSDTVTLDTMPLSEKGNFLLIAEAIAGRAYAAKELARRLPPDVVALQADAMRHLFAQPAAP